MKKNLNLLMNPVRQRIVQYLLVHEKGTTGEMQKELYDIPTSSLYRHINILLEAEYLSVLEEKKKRGMIEKTYGLTNTLTEENPGKEKAAEMIQLGLMSLMTSFGKYFSHEGADPIRDMITYGTSTLLLTDEEFAAVLEQIGKILMDHIGKEKKDGRKLRNLTIISSIWEE